MTFRFQKFLRLDATTVSGSATLGAPWRATTRELQVAYRLAVSLSSPSEQKIDPGAYPLGTMDRGEQSVLVRGTTCFLVERVR